MFDAAVTLALAALSDPVADGGAGLASVRFGHYDELPAALPAAGVDLAAATPGTLAARPKATRVEGVWRLGIALAFARNASSAATEASTRAAANDALETVLGALVRRGFDLDACTVYASDYAGRAVFEAAVVVSIGLGFTYSA